MGFDAVWCGHAVLLDGACHPCPKTSAGPAMVRAGSYCIDSTEVTRGQYTPFIVDNPAQPALCSWNMSRVPTSAWPPLAGEVDLPVVGVDWCDAYEFCAWAGKRLCGQIGGGSLLVTEFDDPAKSQWHQACTAGGVNAFPYGATFEENRCNDGFGAQMSAEVQSFPLCEGGYPGIFDLSGNVWEWEDSCDATVCHIRGGSFLDHPDVQCDRDATYAPDATAPSVGLRCCAP